MKAHPAVPAQVVLRHLQASKNRIERAAQDAERVRAGLRALHEDSMSLRATLRDKPEELAVLERGLMSADFVLGEIVSGNEQLIRIEQALQNELKLWLLRKEPMIRMQQSPAARADVHYVPSKAHEVPTPARTVQGEEVPTPPVDEDKALGYYPMADGTRVYVNGNNDPVAFGVPQPDGSILHVGKDQRPIADPGVPEIHEAAARVEPHAHAAPEAPTLEAPSNGSP